MKTWRLAGGISSALPGPESIVRRVLPNGIVCLVRENHASPAVVIQGMIRAGHVDVNPEKAGLAGVTAGLLDRGTVSRTSAQIAEEVEAVGASLHLGAGWHTTAFGAKCLAEDLDLILGVLADVLQHPVFPSEEIEKVRGEILTDLEERENNTRRMADLEFRALAYPRPHPYGVSPQGYRDTIERLTREDLSDFYKEHYGPRDMLVAVVGGVSAESIHDRVEAVLGGWRGAGPVKPSDLPSLEPLAEVRRKTVSLSGKTQSDIVLGVRGPARKSSDYLAARLADMVLGGFGLMGRLGKNVRDEQGLAYYALSRLEGGLGPGPWMAIAGVNPQNVERAVDSILAELRRLRDTPVEPGELDDAKAYMTGSLPILLETNEGVARALLEMELYNLGLDYLQRYPGLIEALTADEVQEAARTYLNPEAYALAIAGPAEIAD